MKQSPLLLLLEEATDLPIDSVVLLSERIVVIWKPKNAVAAAGVLWGHFHRSQPHH
jgi:hypothetical protein